MTAFKIGSIYRQQGGALVRLSSRSTISNIEADPGCAFAHFVGRASEDGARDLKTGRYVCAAEETTHDCHLIPGECDEHGNPLEDKKESFYARSLAEMLAERRPSSDDEDGEVLDGPARIVGQSQREPKRAPLPGYGQSTPFDNFKGFTTTRDTSEHHSAPFLCASPDLQDESATRHLLVTVKA